MYKGRIPTRQEVAEWSEDKHLIFLAFCKHFITVDGKTKWQVTPEKRAAVIELSASNAHYREFLERVQLPEGETDDRKFYFRLATLVRLVLGYLRLNPDRITARMREVIEGNQRFAWCLTGKAKVVVPTIVPSYPATVQGQMALIHRQTLNLCQMLLESFTPEEIAKMKTKDRLTATARLQQTLGLQGKHEQSRGVFGDILLNQASRLERERAIYSQ